ncbi:hypothetical protein QO003_000899 [Arthrobacter silviterrae]|uniref:Uncharacterized protein n=1 Tax=Arthrobacter silviterrae TaxID=2026658 RepID=A0ABX0DGA4_9MICC|nr:hypothetical protein [Arthrobacter silviterrae]MDQ0276596.1 hypothetical protein [Arthrobacter silviterrae]NGN84786.1 hypothetical protein [Arthrobacter silviterrae]
MDITLLLVVLILVVLFASISVVGALHRIRDASEKALALLENQAARQNTDDSSR